MSNDIEEFLRRAAERRQQAARQRSDQQQAQTRQRSAPQYTDRAAERRVAAPRDAEDEEEVTVVAELVERGEAEYLAGGLAQRRDAERAAKKLSDSQQVSSALLTGQTLVESLYLQLKSPEGLRQAMLIREILDRPTHRW